jgi:hypothetical protein
MGSLLPILPIRTLPLFNDALRNRIYFGFHTVNLRYCIQIHMSMYFTNIAKQMCSTNDHQKIPLRRRKNDQIPIQVFLFPQDEFQSKSRENARNELK